MTGPRAGDGREERTGRSKVVVEYAEGAVAASKIIQARPHPSRYQSAPPSLA